MRRTLLALFFITLMRSSAFLSKQPARLRKFALRSSVVNCDDHVNNHTYLILGGSGQIGSAAANHLLLRQPDATVILTGRNAERGQAALTEVLQSHPTARVRFEQLQDSVWNSSSLELRTMLLENDIDCVIHTAGPYAEEQPVPLQLAMECGCRAYVDVSDPLPFLEQSLLLNGTVKNCQTTALVASGAFPGMSNVIGLEAATALTNQTMAPVESLRFQYFTAGLGGSGNINLYITNLGFGDAMTQYDNGVLRFFMALSGLLLGQVDFFLLEKDIPDCLKQANQQVRERVGRKQVFAWPFPEAATVPTFLKDRDIQNDRFQWRRINSSAAMGTAPDLWNTMLGLLVDLVPRPWWRNQRFSKFLADFSEPLVWLSDRLLAATDPYANGETHAMRVDARLADGSGVSVVQAHDSFRQCVGQSCAEFAMDCLAHPDPGTVSLPEQRYAAVADRERILTALTSTPGTFCYTGPVPVKQIPGPSQLTEMLQLADENELALR